MSDFHIAENLQRLRTFHDFRQKDISEQLHISRQAYSNYERGKRLPDLETTLRLANFYLITLEQLLLAPDPAQMPDAASYGTAGVSPVGTLIPMDGPESRMHRNYKLLPPEEQENVRDYVDFLLEKMTKRRKSNG